MSDFPVILVPLIVYIVFTIENREWGDKWARCVFTWRVTLSMLFSPGGRVICCCSPREVRGQVGASLAAPDQNRGHALEHDLTQLPLGQHTHFLCLVLHANIFSWSIVIIHVFGLKISTFDSCQFKLYSNFNDGQTAGDVLSVKLKWS